MSTDATTYGERLDGVPPHVWYRVCTESANDPQSDTSSSSSSSVAQAAPDAQLTREIIRARSRAGAALRGWSARGVDA